MAHAIKDPITNRLVVAEDEIKKVSVEFCLEPRLVKDPLFLDIISYPYHLEKMDIISYQYPQKL